MPPIREVEQAYLAARADPTFKPELDTHLTRYIDPPIRRHSSA
jgi:tryptophan synthase beta subunit